MVRAEVRLHLSGGAVPHRLCPPVGHARTPGRDTAQSHDRCVGPQTAREVVSPRDTLAVADLGNRKTHEANHSAQELAEILAGFRTARLRLVEHLGTFEPDVFARTSLHPRLKQPMRLVDHLYFVAEHDDHHLAKIWELIAF